MEYDYDKICTLLDKLTLDSLTLMEEQIAAKLELEKCMSDGEINLSKTRYIMGLKNVSRLQLPTDESPEFDAVAVVHPSEDEKLFGENAYDLEIRKKPTNAEESDSFQDPIKWFGYLVPQSLQAAQTSFRRALLWSVKATNIQNQLSQICNNIQKLYSIKASFSNEE